MLPDFRIRQRDYLLEITRTITQELDLDAVLARIVRISAEMLAGQAGLIALAEASVPEISWTLIDESLHVPLDQSLAVLTSAQSPELAAK